MKAKTYQIFSVGPVHKSDKEPHHFRQRMNKFLHSVPVAVVVVVLVVIDCIFVMGELFIDITIYTDMKLLHSESCKKSHHATNGENHSVENVTESLMDASGKQYESREKIADSFHKGSVIVLSIFCVEVILLLISMGPKQFFKSKAEVFDSVVVVVSLSMDIVAFFKWDGIDFLVFLFIMVFWRFVRICNILLATFKRRITLRYDVQRLLRKRAEARLKDAIAMRRTDQEKLKQVIALAKAKGVTDEEIRMCESATSAKRRNFGIFTKSAALSFVNAAGAIVPEKVTFINLSFLEDEKLKNHVCKKGNIDIHK